MRVSVHLTMGAHNPVTNLVCSLQDRIPSESRPTVDEKSQQEGLIHRRQPRRERGSGQQDQSDNVVMQPQRQTGQECQDDQHQPSCDIPPNVMWQPACLSDDPDLVQSYGRHHDNDDYQSGQRSRPTRHIRGKQTVDRKLAKRDVREHADPERTDVPNRGFERHLLESGQDKPEGHSPYAVGHEEAWKEVREGNTH